MRWARTTGTRLAATLLGLLLAACAQGEGQETDLSQASLEELMNVKVTTVSKRLEVLADAPAAIYVITHDDIRRSGMTSLPEVLRLAPGVEVAQVASAMWAISIRGDKNIFANKLLVLVDGRSVYSPSFSGVVWEELDVPLEDIERIEIIRGPGATMWGANAVNGVINIITYSSAATHGGVLSIGGGSYEHWRSFARYGDRVGKHGNYRIYVQHARRGNLARTALPEAQDGWNSTRGGFRSDWQLSAADSLTVQGDVQRSLPAKELLGPSPDAPYPGYGESRGGNLLGRWTHAFSARSTLSMQSYLDVTRENIVGMIGLSHTTADLDVQHNFVAGRHALIWGGGMRVIQQDTTGSLYFRFVHPKATRYLESGFVQDEIVFGRAALTVGSKFEANSFTGVETQPTVRVLVRASPRLAAWASVSRAARTPSEVEREAYSLMPGFTTPWGTLLTVIFMGNPHPRAEHLVAYEVGVRSEVARGVQFDMAAFLNRYDHLVTLRLYDITNPALPVMMLQNGGSGRAYGVETSATWLPRKGVKLWGSYSWLRTSQHDPFGMPSFSKPGDNPDHQFQAHASLSPRRQVELDAGLYFTSRLAGQAVGKHARVDLRLGWRPSERWELSVVGQNLADGTHVEYVTTIQQAPILVRRSVFAKVTFQVHD